MSVFDPSAAAPAEPSEQPGRRLLSERQAEVMERLVTAAAQEAEERPYAEISVRSIAKRAGVAPATAYTYFSGKDHLLAEVLWRRMQASPHLVDLSLALPERVADTARTMGFASMGPAAVAACTTALLGDGPDVKHVRARMGAEIGRRLAAALGSGAEGTVLGVLVVTYTGALLSAGMGHLPFDAVPALMADATALMTGDGAVTTLAPLAYSPYDYAIHEDPYPTYARLRAEAPVFYNEELDFFAFSRHADVLAAFRDVDRYSNAYGVSLDPAAYGPDAHRAMSFLAMDPPRHTRMRSIVGKSFTPRRVAEMEARIRELAVAHLDAALEAGTFDFIARLRRAAAHGRDLRAGRRAAVGPGGGAPPGRPAGAPRGGHERHPPGGPRGGAHPGRLLRRDGRRPPPAPARRPDLRRCSRPRSTATG